MSQRSRGLWVIGPREVYSLGGGADVYRAMCDACRTQVCFIENSQLGLEHPDSRLLLRCRCDGDAPPAWDRRTNSETRCLLIDVHGNVEHRVRPAGDPRYHRFTKPIYPRLMATPQLFDADTISMRIEVTHFEYVGTTPAGIEVYEEQAARRETDQPRMGRTWLTYARAVAQMAIVRPEVVEESLRREPRGDRPLCPQCGERVPAGEGEICLIHTERGADLDWSSQNRRINDFLEGREA